MDKCKVIVNGNEYYGSLYELSGTRQSDDLFPEYQTWASRFWCSEFEIKTPYRKSKQEMINDLEKIGIEFDDLSPEIKEK